MLEGTVVRLRAEDLRRLQERRLAKIVRYAYRNAPLYRARWRSEGIDPSRIRSPEDLARLPFTTRRDLRETYPFGLLAVPLSSVVRFHASAAGDGGPWVVAHTAKDMENWTRLVARGFECAGARNGDIVQNLLCGDLSTGGLALQAGAEYLGLAALPVGSGELARQLALIRDMGSTILCCTPSQALALGEAAVGLGYRPREDLRLRLGMLWGEPLAEEARRRIEGTFGIRAVDHYGPVEVCGPGTAVECPLGEGLHLWADHLLPEVIDPSSGEVLGPGERGELVLTHLAREAMPLVRYRTGDLTAIDEEECPCGNSFPLMAPPRGRVEDGEDPLGIGRGLGRAPARRRLQEETAWRRRRHAGTR